MTVHKGKCCGAYNDNQAVDTAGIKSMSRKGREKMHSMVKHSTTSS